MFKSKSLPFEDDIEKATHENNLTEDWSLIMQICDNAINYQDGAKFCLKAIMKRLHHSVPRVVLQTLTLLDSCVKNCDRRFLLQVASSEFTAEVRKLLLKMHPSAATKLKELLQKWSLEEFKDDPELCIIPSLYYKLKSEGVEFPSVEKEKKIIPPICTDPNAVTSQEEENDIIKAIEISLKDTGKYDSPADYGYPNVASEDASKYLPEPFKVRAVYDFEAAEDNELTIKTGEIVLVLDNSNANWWKGSNHKGEGLFPASFVSEDLDVEPEEPLVVETVTVVDKEPDIPPAEVKLDEEKIELCVNWLNDTDPTSELPDPEDMLLLERECCSMAPLIEENLQAIDNRLAMLNVVNEKIITAFELFHSLSDRWPPSNMTYYPYPCYGPQYPFSQATLPSEASMPPTNNQSGNIQGMACSPVPLFQPQYVMDNEYANKKQQMPMPENTSEISAADSINITQPNVSNSIGKTLENQTTQSAMMLNPSNTTPAPLGAYFIPPAMPYTVQSQPNLSQQGFVQTPGALPNFMPIPYPASSVGPYFPVQYYYINSNAFPAQTVNPSSSTQSQNKETVKKPADSAFVTAQTNTTSVTASNYSADLQNITYSNSSAVNEENGKEVTLADTSNQVNATVQVHNETREHEQLEKS